MKLTFSYDGYDFEITTDHHACNGPPVVLSDGRLVDVDVIYEPDKTEEGELV